METITINKENFVNELANVLCIFTNKQARDLKVFINDSLKNNVLEVTKVEE